MPSQKMTCALGLEVGYGAGHILLDLEQVDELGPGLLCTLLDILHSCNNVRVQKEICSCMKATQWSFVHVPGGQKFM